jgi:anti-sigma regulatory factor (Ser/Thr protein kinase)
MCDLTPDQTVTLSDSHRGPAEARSFVRQHNCPEHGAIAMDALVLITSELVTNAVRYGLPPIVLRLSCRASELRLSVSDTGPDLPREQATRGSPGDTGAGGPPPEGGTHGSLGVGLVIVAETSEEWGTTPLTIGKDVWCRVAAGVKAKVR